MKKLDIEIPEGMTAYEIPKVNEEEVRKAWKRIELILTPQEKMAFERARQEVLFDEEVRKFFDKVNANIKNLFDNMADMIK